MLKTQPIFNKGYLLYVFYFSNQDLLIADLKLKKLGTGHARYNSLLFKQIAVENLYCQCSEVEKNEHFIQCFYSRYLNSLYSVQRY